MTLALSQGCATQKSVIEIPSCADRVEIEGQAERLSKTRFELDHSFDLAFSRTRLAFEQGGQVRELTVDNNQPDPLRLFAGAGAGVLGVLLLGSAAYDVSNGVDPFAQRPLLSTIGGAGLIGLGAAAALTGWHPARRYVTFPGACDDDGSVRLSPDARGDGRSSRPRERELPDGVFER